MSLVSWMNCSRHCHTWVLSGCTLSFVRNVATMSVWMESVSETWRVSFESCTSTDTNGSGEIKVKSGVCLGALMVLAMWATKCRHIRQQYYAFSKINKCQQRKKYSRHFLPLQITIVTMRPLKSCVFIFSVNSKQTLAFTQWGNGCFNL